MNEDEGVSEVNESTTSTNESTDQVKVEDQTSTEQTGDGTIPSSEAETGTTDVIGTGITNIDSSQVIVTAPIDPREQTIVTTGDGAIVVIHEITLGDVVISTLMLSILIFMLLDKLINRRA